VATILWLMSVLNCSINNAPIFVSAVVHFKNPNLYINRHVMCFSHKVKVYFDLCRMKAIFGLTNFSGEPTQA